MREEKVSVQENQTPWGMNQEDEAKREIERYLKDHDITNIKRLEVMTFTYIREIWVIIKRQWLGEREVKTIKTAVKKAIRKVFKTKTGNIEFAVFPDDSETVIVYVFVQKR